MEPPLTLTDETPAEGAYMIVKSHDGAVALTAPENVATQLPDPASLGSAVDALPQ
jgi:hypothetical protein